MNIELKDDIVPLLYEWLGINGRKFFSEVLKEFGTLGAVIPIEHKLNPHSSFRAPWAVHFNEGMDVRNFIRKSFPKSKLDLIDLDDNWEELILLALNYKPKFIPSVNRLNTIE